MTVSPTSSRVLSGTSLLVGSLMTVFSIYFFIHKTPFRGRLFRGSKAALHRNLAASLALLGGAGLTTAAIASSRGPKKKTLVPLNVTELLERIDHSLPVFQASLGSPESPDEVIEHALQVFRFREAIKRFESEYHDKLITLTKLSVRKRKLAALPKLAAIALGHPENYERLISARLARSSGSEATFLTEVLRRLPQRESI